MDPTIRNSSEARSIEPPIAVSKPSIPDGNTPLSDSPKGRRAATPDTPLAPHPPPSLSLLPRPIRSETPSPRLSTTPSNGNSVSFGIHTGFGSAAPLSRSSTPNGASTPSGSTTAFPPPRYRSPVATLEPAPGALQPRGQHSLTSTGSDTGLHSPLHTPTQYAPTQYSTRGRSASPTPPTSPYVLPPPPFPPSPGAPPSPATRYRVRTPTPPPPLASLPPPSPHPDLPAEEPFADPQLDSPTALSYLQPMRSISTILPIDLTTTVDELFSGSRERSRERVLTPRIVPHTPSPHARRHTDRSPHGSPDRSATDGAAAVAVAPGIDSAIDPLHMVAAPFAVQPRIPIEPLTQSIIDSVHEPTIAFTTALAPPPASPVLPSGHVHRRSITAFMGSVDGVFEVTPDGDIVPSAETTIDSEQPTPSIHLQLVAPQPVPDHLLVPRGRKRSSSSKNGATKKTQDSDAEVDHSARKKNVHSSKQRSSRSHTPTDTTLPNAVVAADEGDLEEGAKATVAIEMVNLQENRDRVLTETMEDLSLHSAMGVGLGTSSNTSSNNISPVSNGEHNDNEEEDNCSDNGNVNNDNRITSTPNNNGPVSPTATVITIPSPKPLPNEEAAKNDTGAETNPPTNRTQHYNPILVGPTYTILPNRSSTTSPTAASTSSRHAANLSGTGGGGNGGGGGSGVPAFFVDETYLLSPSSFHRAAAAGMDKDATLVIEDPVWGEYPVSAAPAAGVPVGKLLAISCLPCLVPPFCSVSRKQAYRRVCISMNMLIMAVQIAMFVYSLTDHGFAPVAENNLIGPWPHTMDRLHAKNSAMIVYRHQVWRIFSPIFLHAGVVHILANILVQLRIGLLMERTWGLITFTCIYLMSGMVASTWSAVLLPDTLGVGSSGALLGLMGAWLAHLLCHWFVPVGHTDSQKRSQLVALLINIVIVLAFSFTPHTDWVAHVFGLLAGFLLGLAFFAPAIFGIVTDATLSPRSRWDHSVNGGRSPFLQALRGRRDPYPYAHNSAYPFPTSQPPAVVPGTTTDSVVGATKSQDPAMLSEIDGFIELQHQIHQEIVQQQQQRPGHKRSGSVTEAPGGWCGRQLRTWFPCGATGVGCKEVSASMLRLLALLAFAAVFAFGLFMLFGVNIYPSTSLLNTCKTMQDAFPERDFRCKY